MDALLPHWPILVAALIFAALGQLAKGAVFTPEAIKAASRRGKLTPLGHLLWWGRKTLPLHPVLAGLALGMVPGMPLSPGVPATAAAACLYYAGAGILSTYGFSLLKGLLKRHDLDLEQDQ